MPNSGQKYGPEGSARWKHPSSGRLLAVLFAVSLMVVSCGRTQPSTAAAVGVRSSGCSLADSFGSGVAIGSHLIVTSAHTIAGATEITIVDQAGAEAEAKVVGFDSGKDIAILSVSNVLPYSLLGPIEPGETGILVTWKPANGFLEEEVEVTRRLLVTIENIYLTGSSERRAIELLAEIEPGDSGGPVFSRDGRVAGIIYGRSRERASIGFAVRAVEIESLLGEISGDMVENGHCL